MFASNNDLLYSRLMQDLQHKTFPPYMPKNGEAYMNPKQRGHFKKVPKALKEEL